MNWGIKLLQSSALPLGYGAIKNGADYEARPSKLKLLPARTRAPKQFTELILSLRDCAVLALFLIKKMERITRLELATSTLARWRSTG